MHWYHGIVHMKFQYHRLRRQIQPWPRRRGVTPRRLQWLGVTLSFKWTPLIKNYEMSSQKCGTLIISKCMFLECEVRNYPLAIVRRRGRLFSIKMNVSMKLLNILSRLQQMLQKLQWPRKEQHNELINSNSSTDIKPCFSKLKAEYNNMNTCSSRLREIMPKLWRNNFPTP